MTVCCSVVGQLSRPGLVKPWTVLYLVQWDSLGWRCVTLLGFLELQLNSGVSIFSYTSYRPTLTSKLQGFHGCCCWYVYDMFLSFCHFPVKNIKTITSSCVALDVRRSGTVQIVGQTCEKVAAIRSHEDWLNLNSLLLWFPGGTV